VNHDNDDAFELNRYQTTNNKQKRAKVVFFFRFVSQNLYKMKLLNSIVLRIRTNSFVKPHTQTHNESISLFSYTHPHMCKVFFFFNNTTPC
jgi:hypothetical protein